MIDVRDLMVGNYFYVGELEKHLVASEIDCCSATAFVNGEMITFNKVNLTPISITPEWLEQLGFEWLDKKHGVLGKGFFTAYTKATSKTRGCVFEANFIPGDAFCVARFEVEYIHDLQNLMRSTTKAAIKLEDWA